ncbi:MAG: cell division protein FtsZ [Cytophagaceae bacterium]
MSQLAYKFDLPSHHKSIIKVIGVGGGGSNAVNHMFNMGIKDVEFVVCNTDVQALKASPVPNKIQIGINLTDGLGAGANPDKGKHAALESREEIREFLSNNTKMLFITAGMGGGTGTGAAPVIAKIAKEMDILTVGICTVPFNFEGKKKRLQADTGIAELKAYCDTVLIILNDKLREIYGNLSIREAFAQADNVLTNAAKSIAEIITVTSEVNVDFEDVKTVMSNSGAAVMGSAVTCGEGRARRAAEEALSSPLLNNTDIHGAKKILLSIMSGEEAQLTMDELSEITDYIEERAGDDAEVIFGEGIDTSLGENIRVTVIATGFHEKEYVSPKRTIIDLESERPVNIAPEPEQPVVAPPVQQPINRRPVGEPLTFTFDLPKSQPAPEPAPEVKAEKKVYNLDSGLDFPKKEEAQRSIFSEVKPLAGEPVNDAEEQKKKYFLEQAQARKEKLNKISSSSMNPDEFKEKLEVPAYMRKNVNLQDYPHSSERNISRYNLNDDNEILGNNKFLHDNVD